MNIADQAHQIAQHLPGTWTVEDARDWIADIRRADGVEVCIRTADRDRRLEIFIAPVSYVDRRHHTNYHLCDHPHITCAVSRGPEAIARDIERRILSAAIAYHAEAEQWLDAQQINDAEIEAARAKLLALPGALESWNDTIHCGKFSAEVSSANYITVRIGSLTIDQALAVANALAAA